MTRRRIQVTILLLILFALLLNTGCKKEPEAVKEEKGFYVEEYQILVPNLHGFEKQVPQRQDAREIILLTKGGATLWLSRFDEIVIYKEIDTVISMIWRFAQSRVYNISYLKGVKLKPLEITKQDNPTRPYVEQLLQAERTQELYDLLDPIDKTLLAYELERFPIGKKMIVANYYTPVGPDVFVLTLAAPASEFFFIEEDAKKIFFELQFNVETRPKGY
jgi:hypothetical protein